MLSKKYLDELMRFHEIKEAKEAEENKAREALGKFLKEKHKNTLGEENKIGFIM